MPADIQSFAGQPSTQALIWSCVDAAVLAGIIALTPVLSRMIDGALASHPLRRLRITLEKRSSSIMRLARRAMSAVLTHHHRWAIMLGSLTCVALVGAYGPPQIALPVLCVGLAWSFLLYKIWSEDEVSRDRPDEFDGRLFTSPDPLGPQTTPTTPRNDLTEIVWVAAISAALIFPLLFYQVDVLSAQHAFQKGTDDRGVGLYARFFIAQLQRTIPFLREGDLVHAQLFDDILPTPPLGAAATFVFRVIGDLLILAVLIKVFSVIWRVRTGEDLRRQEKKLESSDDNERLAAVAELKNFVLYRGRPGAAQRLIELARAPWDADISDELRAAVATALQNAVSGLPLARIPMLTAAASAWRTVISLLGSERASDLASAHQNLGNTLLKIGEVTRGSEGLGTLRDSVSEHNKALEYRTPDIDLLGHATTGGNKAWVLVRLGQRLPEGEATEALKEAEALFREVREIWISSSCVEDAGDPRLWRPLGCPSSEKRT